MELKPQQSFATEGGVSVPPVAVITDIEGGMRPSDYPRVGDRPEGFRWGTSTFDTEEVDRRAGIYTSVRMEQSVV